jgi:hypothetical protein
MTPSGARGVLNDAPSIHFLDATLASVLVARWCARPRGRDRGRLVVWRSLLNHRWAGPAKAPAPGRARSHTRRGRPVALIRVGGAGHALWLYGLAASAVWGSAPGGGGIAACDAHAYF